jgi:biotin carboxyl carrier protein
MTFEIEIDGRVIPVAIERAGEGRYRVVVHDGTRLVDAARIGEHGLSLLLDGGGNASRDVQIAPAGARGEFLVSVDGRTVPVTVNGRRTRRVAGDAVGTGHGEQTIVAPMPGRVVRVLVGPGDEVAARQPLVVVEAMKMENELRSPRAGTIKEVTVSAGMSVDAGRVLVTVA